MALLEKKGYGQVEPNHLSAQRTGQIYAQLPCDEAITVLENGSFLKYHYAAGKADTDTAENSGEWLLVYNEVKNYDPKKTYKDFAIKKDEQVGGVITPRLFKTNDGDIFTTNLVDFTAEKGSRKNKLLTVKKNGNVGILTETQSPTVGEVVWVVAEETTLPDGQYAVKVQRLYTKTA